MLAVPLVVLATQFSEHFDKFPITPAHMSWVRPLSLSLLFSFTHSTLSCHVSRSPHSTAPTKQRLASVARPYSAHVMTHSAPLLAQGWRLAYYKVLTIPHHMALCSVCRCQN